MKGYCGWGGDEIEKVKGHPCSKELLCSFRVLQGNLPKRVANKVERRKTQGGQIPDESLPGNLERPWRTIRN